MPQGKLEAAVNTDIHYKKSPVDLKLDSLFVTLITGRIGQLWVGRGLTCMKDFHGDRK